MSPTAFGEVVSPTDTIAAILGSYPFSIGLLRELIQNSDDAKASKQIFVLDRRTHPKCSLFDPKLADTQGPALLAYNDALFTETDWEALQSIHKSSKKSDTTTTGKYGIGFRASYHVTDNPQILSGSSLAILDPHHAFTSSGGTKFDFVELGQKYIDQLSGFDFFVPPTERGQPFTGSIIRLPLRTENARSSLSSKVVQASEILTLLEDFIKEEIAITPLFLRKIRAVELHVIDPQGVRRCLAKVALTKDTPVDWKIENDLFSSFIATVTLEASSISSTTKWRILNTSFDKAQSASLVSYHIGTNARPVLAKHKLFPDLGIAYPLFKGESLGRLFTFLPLPIRTGFPAHVHGLFALTQSRQNLANSSEVGIVRGSDDSVLVEWNQLLFDTYIPKAWGALFPVLTRVDRIGDVYSAWPSQQPRVETGDSTYWKNFPRDLLSAVVVSCAEVWPLVTTNLDGRNEAPVYVAFDKTTLVAPATMGADVLSALVKTGLKIIQPPQYLLNLIESAKFPYTAATSEAVARRLHEYIPGLEKLALSCPSDCLVILQYLLASRNLVSILGLPIVPVIGGQFVALFDRNDAAKTYTMMERSDIEVFEKFDPFAIALNKLPPGCDSLFCTQDGLNLASLGRDQISTYLRLMPNPFGMDLTKGGQVDVAGVNWLSRFWQWFRETSEEMKVELVLLVRSLYLLPSRSGKMVRVSDGIFVDTDLDPVVTSCLESLAVDFVHPKFWESALVALRSSIPDVVKAPNDIHSVLDKIQGAKQFDGESAAAMLKYICRFISEACRQKPLDEKQRASLRALPIYPLLQPSAIAIKAPKVSRVLSSLHLKSIKGNTTRVIAPISQHAIVRGISSSNTTPLPVVQNVVYLDGSAVDMGILTHLHADSVTSMANVDILALALQYFCDQSRYLQGVFLDYMVQNRDSLPPSILKSLQKVKFIPVEDGTMQSPDHIVDPKSSLTALFSERGDRIPKISSRMDDDASAFLKQLKALGLLRDKLTPEVVHERVQFIASSHSNSYKMATDLAIKLLESLYTSDFDCSQVDFPSDAKWLPTNRGMLSHEECLDRGSHRPELFDEVLPLLDDIQVSPSLRHAFGWNKPISTSTLSQQLRLVIGSSKVNSSSPRKLRAIIKELSRRALSEEDVQVLITITSKDAWIPISSSILAKTSQAVFKLAFPLVGFFELPQSLAERDDIRNFLMRLGCSERPSVDLLSAELAKLRLLPPGESVVEQGLQILRALPVEMNDRERDGVFVPDAHSTFRLVSQVYFNDVGDRAYFEAGDHFLAHPKLDDPTARKLRMKRLGLTSIHLNKPGVDMGEKLATTIRNVLKQYTDQQALTEFLANACDAGADEFKILVDDNHGPTSNLLTPQMAPFQACSSLIIYNNSVFTQKDFDGILAVGTGGKEGKTNTIGQFGLGALSMFHFTELAMILSGDKVLFLDPSKTHLPFEDWASLLIPLSQMERLYPGHLVCLDTIFDYRLSYTTYYTGTLFRLPLRNSAHVGPKSILQTLCPTSYVRDRIVRLYWKQGQTSLLFTGVKAISTYYRDSSGRQSQGWSLYANRVYESGDFNTYTLSMSGRVSENAGIVKDEWKVVTSSTSLGGLPRELDPLIEPHRLRSPIVVGLAARIGLEKGSIAHNLFSTLPLPMSTNLPVHLTASFILTPDRRHVRFDDYDNLESKYNRWLLSTIAPPLYLYLLESLLKTHGQNNLFWPGNTNTPDPVTRFLVDSFYKTYLPRSQRIVWTSLFDRNLRLSPCHMVMLGAEPPLITKILSLLPNPRFVRFPPAVHERSLGHVPTVDREFLISEIKKHSTFIVSLYQKGDISHDNIQCLLDCLSEGEKIDLAGLPLLPLADGELALLEAEGSDVKTCYAWKQDHMLFEPSQLIHPEFDVRALLGKGYNLDTLATEKALLGLIKSHLLEAEMLWGVKQDKASWISAFWEEYPKFPVRPDIEFFPLVPSTRPGHFVSLNSCSTNPSIVLMSHIDGWLCECMDKLGASVVMRDEKTLPRPLRDMLQAYPAFSFSTMLLYMKSIKQRLSAVFLELDKDMHIKFAEWARTQIVLAESKELDTVRLLPIWPEVKPVLEEVSFVSLRQGSEVRMLPYLVPPEAVGRFVKVPVVEYSTPLRNHLNVQPISHSQLWDLLDLPSALITTLDQSAYRQLLIKFLADTTFEHAKLLLPNTNGYLKRASELYTRHPFFVAAFGGASPNFLLENYRDMEALLEPTRIKGQNNLDLDTFIVCATSINDDTTARDRRERATVVFQAYCQDLPLRLDAGDSVGWSRLDDLRFIPREPMRHRSMRIPENSPYVKPLQDLVSPKEMLRPDFEAIAWTQRAMSMVSPHSRIMISNPTLGTPTIAEVVEHLLVLALQVARDHPSNQHVLSSLEATYKWLDDHQDEAADIIIEYHDKPLFLNVDDPKREHWVWHCADEMFFNISDSDMKPVGKFLQDFEDLLTVAGVESIVNPTVPEGTLVVTAQAKLSAFHDGFNLMRVEGKLTDVVFVTSDEPEQRFLAHRAILAPMSEYLRDLFCGDFTESGPASAEEPIEVDLEYSGKCVGCILDHLYTGQPPDLEHLALSDALDALDLSQYWGLRDLNELIQVNIIQKNFITPVTFEEILDRASRLDARLVLEACQFFERENKDAILRLKGEFRGTRRPKRLPKKNVQSVPFIPGTRSSSSGFERFVAPKSTKVKQMLHRMSASWSRKLNPKRSDVN